MSAACSADHAMSVRWCASRLTPYHDGMRANPSENGLVPMFGKQRECVAPGGMLACAFDQRRHAG